MFFKNSSYQKYGSDIPCADLIRFPQSARNGNRLELTKRGAVFGGVALIAFGRAYVESDAHSAGYETYKFGDLEVDLGSREARVAGRDVGLKPREFALLTLFVANPGIALSRSKILESVWGFDYDGDDRTLDVHVRRLRMKIEELHGFPKCIHTLYGYGYRFAAPKITPQGCKRLA